MRIGLSMYGTMSSMGLHPQSGLAPLKDYMIFLSEEGYRLVRCPLGQGVINFPALFTIFSEVCPDAPLSIELGALEARHIRVLADDYWPEYPTRSAAHFAHVWHFVQANA